MISNLEEPIKADAILWDFDGTLADSAAKNIAITKQILARVAPHLTGDKLPISLQSTADYHAANHGADHWRDLYRDFFGMTTEEIEKAGPMWETYQMLDKTEVTLFDGISDTVNCFSNYPQGICSANSTANIRQVLSDNRINTAFQSVIGYEDLPHHHQKPAPDGGLKCLQDIFGHTRNKTIIFIGDHVADVLFARALNERLGSSSTVISVIVTYSGAKPDCWKEQPDKIIDTPSELAEWITDQNPGDSPVQSHQR
jgi:phosphoglycolate phosphatase-like HAD superfamily hydrolase